MKQTNESKNNYIPSSLHNLEPEVGTLDKTSLSSASSTSAGRAVILIPYLE